MDICGLSFDSWDRCIQPQTLCGLCPFPYVFTCLINMWLVFQMGLLTSDYVRWFRTPCCNTSLGIHAAIGDSGKTLTKVILLYLRVRSTSWGCICLKCRENTALVKELRFIRTHCDVTLSSLGKHCASYIQITAKSMPSLQFLRRKGLGGRIKI